jgi:hypothetical protein
MSSVIPGPGAGGVIRANEALVRVRDDGKEYLKRISELRPDSIGAGIGGIANVRKNLKIGLLMPSRYDRRSRYPVEAYCKALCQPTS